MAAGGRCAVPGNPGRPKVPQNVSGLCWDGVVTAIGPAQLARLLRLPEPTPEQAAVISAPLGPLAVFGFTRWRRGRGPSGQSEPQT